jgi:hypothetical protein
MRLLPVIALLALLINVPFGYWRAGVRKFSWRWIVAVHAPVPIVIGLRFAAGIGYAKPLLTIPVMVAAYFTGQLLGSRLRKRRTAAAAAEAAGSSPE